MFRHGDDIYLIARTDPDGTFYTGKILNFTKKKQLKLWKSPCKERNLENDNLHHLIDLGAYSLRRHGTALYKLIDGQPVCYKKCISNFLSRLIDPLTFSLQVLGITLFEHAKVN